jgi:GTPase involved in cell partitioning and DNA repair
LKPLQYRVETELEIEIEDVYKPNSVLDFPIRPSWSYGVSREVHEAKEQKYFDKYLDEIFSNYEKEELSYFEMNLETWRQLWRVLEISDIILFIVDIRFASLQFSPKFFDYCHNTIKKDLIIVLNKIDLVPTYLAAAWKSYFERKFPQIHVLLFSSSKQIKYKRNNTNNSNTILSKSEQDQHAAKIQSLAAELHTSRAHRQLYESVEKIVNNQVDLNDWNDLTKKIVDNTLNNQHISHVNIEDIKEMNSLYESTSVRSKFENGYVTIGCCGKLIF